VVAAAQAYNQSREPTLLIKPTAQGVSRIAASLRRTVHDGQRLTARTLQAAPKLPTPGKLLKLAINSGDRIVASPEAGRLRRQEFQQILPSNKAVRFIDPFALLITPFDSQSFNVLAQKGMHK
jgi:hypothetical protein